ncbi:hypothetical protein [Mucilaginibacter polytrichastri]|nr:hypothetical protein [Mucilaginibacter polytrichastri]SFS58360.1 hypothetical protein SAMN04487890_10210 [Mucilaginibacter polytrichastri]
MKLFRKRERALSQAQEQRAGKIAAALLARQRKTADYLNRRTELISGKNWMLLLIGFCTVFGSYCIYLLIKAFH